MSTSVIFRRYSGMHGCPESICPEMNRRWDSKATMRINSASLTRRKKKEGDGFQADCICDEGYTFTFYFRNPPAPKKYLAMGFLPLYSRCMALYNCFMDKYHMVRFDNLYMSGKFSLGSLVHPRKVQTEGVTRTSQRCLPTQIIQHRGSAPW